MEIKQIDISKIEADKNQPRKFFSKEKLEDLTKSILKQGLLEPLKVIKLKESYMIIDGERRYRVFSDLLKIGNNEFKKIDCIILNKIQNKTIIQLTYDVHKERLVPLEEAESYFRLMKEKNYTVTEISYLIGKKKNYVQDKLRLIHLQEKTKQLIRDKKISASELSSLKLNDMKKLEKKILKRTENKNLYKIDFKAIIKNHVARSSEKNFTRDLFLNLASLDEDLDDFFEWMKDNLINDKNKELQKQIKEFKKINNNIKKIILNIEKRKNEG